MAWQTVKENVAAGNGLTADLERNGTDTTSVFFLYVYDSSENLVRQLSLGKIDTSVVSMDEIIQRAANIFHERCCGA